MSIKISDKLKEAKEKSKSRHFAQSWDLIFNLRDVDLKKPENRLNLEFHLPEGLGKTVKTAFIVDSLFSEAKKQEGSLVITKAEIPKYAKDKKKLKRLANEYEWWFGEAPLMPIIGKELGAILGTRGKMPKPVPPKVNLEGIVKRVSESVRVRLTNTPVIQLAVGVETMPEDKVSKNVEAAYNFVREHLPKGKNSIKNIYVKLTMGKPVKLEL